LRGIEALIKQRIPATDRREHGGGEHHRAEAARQAPRGGHHRQGGRPQFERPQVERPSLERGFGERSYGERPQTSFQPALRDAGERRAADLSSVGFMRPARPGGAADSRKRQRGGRAGGR
jgi:hypothetical protein